MLPIVEVLSEGVVEVKSLRSGVEIEVRAQWSWPIPIAKNAPQPITADKARMEPSRP